MGRSSIIAVESKLTTKAVPSPRTPKAVADLCLGTRRFQRAISASDLLKQKTPSQRMRARSDAYPGREPSEFSKALVYLTPDAFLLYSNKEAFTFLTISGEAFSTEPESKGG